MAQGNGGTFMTIETTLSGFCTMPSGKTRFAPLLLLCLLAGPVHAFGFGDVVKKARTLAESQYQAPPAIPAFLKNLPYEDYQKIRFRPEESLWQQGKSRFQIMMMPAGQYYTYPVALNQVDLQGSHPITFDKSVFNYPDQALAKRIPADLGYAGFKLTYPLEGPGIRNQFLVFGGASYFRGVARDQRFGLSARGIAVDTGLSSGEEFPGFVEFWLERPAANSDHMRLYGLLNGPSITGAYRFDVFPGDTTRIDVTAELFFRNDIEQLGLAPLTSMFYYGENSVRPVGEWRPQVHDSDGLLIHDGKTGEWLWRPLINPTNLKLSYHHVPQVSGFGLIQRDTAFHQFQDSEAGYQQRPSAWVKAKGDWGPGKVVLVEIPTDAETNDNIVAFWKPDQAIQAGKQYRLEYSLSFGGPSVAGHPGGQAANTFIGDGDRIGGGETEGGYRIIVDFAGGELGELPADAAVVSKVSGGESVEVLEHFVEYVPESGHWRLSMLARPAPQATMELRAYLELKGKVLTETWTYSLPPGTGLRANQR